MAAGGYQEKVFKSDQEAVTAIRRAVRNANGSMLQAAKLLGVSFRTLSRYVTKLGLRDELKLLKSKDLKVTPLSSDTTDYSALARASLKPSKG